MLQSDAEIGLLLVVRPVLVAPVEVDSHPRLLIRSATEAPAQREKGARAPAGRREEGWGREALRARGCVPTRRAVHAGAVRAGKQAAGEGSG